MHPRNAIYAIVSVPIESAAFGLWAQPAQSALKVALESALKVALKAALKVALKLESQMSAFAATLI